MAENNSTSTANDVQAFQPGNKIGFQPGQSGNPGGKPKKLAELVDLARSLAPDAIKALLDDAADRMGNQSVSCPYPIYGMRLSIRLVTSPAPSTGSGAACGPDTVLGRLLT